MAFGFGKPKKEEAIKTDFSDVKVPTPPTQKDEAMMEMMLNLQQQIAKANEKKVEVQEISGFTMQEFVDFQTKMKDKFIEPIPMTLKFNVMTIEQVINVFSLQREWSEEHNEIPDLSINETKIAYKK